MKTLTYKFTLSALITFSMTACSTTPATPKSALKEAILNSNVVVAPIANPAQLAERTKAQAIGNFVVASVVSSAVGSSADAVNAQEMQANMQIMQSFNQNLQQALPSSYVVSAGKGADLALAKKISDYLGSKVQSITPNSQDYALNYNLRMTLLEQKEGKQQAIKTVSCGSSAIEKMPLDQWKAENYKAVDASAEIIVNKCFNQFLAETGLD
jgi:hypothetical protein